LKPPNRYLIAIKNQPRLALLVALLILLLGVWGAFWQGKSTALERLELELDRSAVSRQDFLRRDLQNPLLVPQVLAASTQLRALLRQPTSAIIDEQNQVLEETARATGLDVLYVMDHNGDTLVASNWRAVDSFVGKNYRFRPYFQQAFLGQTGRYIAKGITSDKLGYYLATPVRVDGRIRGVVVAKISFGALQARTAQLWSDEQELDLVSDENGVVVASALSGQIFKSITPMADSLRKAVVTSKQYGDAIEVLPMTLGQTLSKSIRMVQFAAVPDTSFMQKAYIFPELGLRLYRHLPASRYWEIVAEFTAMFSLVALVLLLAAVGMFQRWVYTAQLIDTAIHDPLTGLHTRLYMSDWCHDAIRVHNRDPAAGFGLIIFDLDFFKQVNDTYGHMTGDVVLRRVGQILRSAIRGQDLAVRFGGEELALFVRCAEPADARALAERVRRSVEQSPFDSQGKCFPVTVSGGVAYHAVGETQDELFVRADKKLYEAKERGRNQIRD